MVERRIEDMDKTLVTLVMDMEFLCDMGGNSGPAERERYTRYFTRYRPYMNIILDTLSVLPVQESEEMYEGTCLRAVGYDRSFFREVKQDLQWMVDSGTAGTTDPSVFDRLKKAFEYAIVWKLRFDKMRVASLIPEHLRSDKMRVASLIPEYERQA